MKQKTLPTLCLFILSAVSVTQAQAPLERSITRLQSEIAVRESIDHDARITPHHRAINRRLLDKKRQDLRAAIHNRIAALQKYLTSEGKSITQDQKNHAQSALRTLVASTNRITSPAAFSATRPRRAFGMSALGNPLIQPPSPELVAPTAVEVITSRPLTAGAMSPVAPANASGPLPAPQSQVAVIRTEPTSFPDTSETYRRLDLPNAAIFNSDDAAKIIKDAIAAGNVLEDANGDAPPQDADGNFLSDFYCVIHVLRWANPANTRDAAGDEAKAQSVAAQNWYVFNSGKGKGSGRNRLWSNEDFAKLNRIFGARKVWLLYIHLNRAADYEYKQARYDFNIEKKTPANVTNLLNAAQLFIDFTSAKTLDLAQLAPSNLWGGGAVEVAYVPSNITVTGSFVKTVEAGPVVALDKPKTFDNEGRYWWDVSVGVPIRRISQTQFDATAGTVTAKTVDKQNAFALLNLYPVPVDIKGTNYSWIPHFVGGVAIAKQPLKKILIGAGIGPHFANFYVGALFTEQKRPSSLEEGDAATPAQLDADSRKRYKTQFSFGINLPVRGIVESLKKTSQ